MIRATESQVAAPRGDDLESRGIGRSDVLHGIGRTPLLRLERLARRFGVADGVQVYAKAEHLNPGGSVKDRAARAIILEAERTGALVPGKTLLDATSGNTGIAYAMLGAALGYPVVLCLPQNASVERKQLLVAYGARIVETDPLGGTDAAQRRAQALAEEHPERYFYANQYDNDANWRAHFDTTAPEIWAQTQGRVTHFIAGLGTSGTFVGTTRRLRQLNPALRAVSMQPSSPLHGLEGMKHMPTSRVPAIYDRSLADLELRVDTTDAQRMTRALAREEGLLVGTSSGANVHAALDLARSLPVGSVVVTVLCDSGSRYLGEAYWQETGA